jgi:hypothetical protein
LVPTVRPALRPARRTAVPVQSAARRQIKAAGRPDGGEAKRKMRRVARRLRRAVRALGRSFVVRGSCSSTAFAASSWNVDEAEVTEASDWIISNKATCAH